MKNPFGPNNWLPNLIKLAWIGVNIYLFVSSYLKYANGEGIFLFSVLFTHAIGLRLYNTFSMTRLGLENLMFLE